MFIEIKENFEWRGGLAKKEGTIAGISPG